MAPELRAPPYRPAGRLRVEFLSKDDSEPILPAIWQTLDLVYFGPKGHIEKAQDFQVSFAVLKDNILEKVFYYTDRR
jgi:hypothetical protein